MYHVAHNFKKTHGSLIAALFMQLQRKLNILNEHYHHPKHTPVQDAPVENAHLFHERVTHFMNTYIAKNKGGLLGRVTHYVIRYEVQARGSIHAHIILWLHPDDVETVTSEIVAVVPAKFVQEDETNPQSAGAFVDPSDERQLRLFHLVRRKQMHRCGEVR
jgi:hypothetical protein